MAQHLVECMNCGQLHTWRDGEPTIRTCLNCGEPLQDDTKPLSIERPRREAEKIRAAIRAQGAKDEAERAARPRQIGDTVTRISDGATGTIEQITDDQVLLRLQDGAFVWVERRTIGL